MRLSLTVKPEYRWRGLTLSALRKKFLKENGDCSVVGLCLSAAWDFHKEHGTGWSLRHGYSVILFCIRRSGVLSSAALLFWAVSSPFFWLISAKTAAKAAYPVSCPMLCRERGDPLRGTGRVEPDPRCPATRPRGGGGTQGGGGAAAPGLRPPWWPHGVSDDTSARARAAGSASGPARFSQRLRGAVRGSKVRLGKGWHVLKIWGGKVLSRGWRRQGYFPPPPPSPAGYLGGGTGHHALEGAAAVGRNRRVAEDSRGTCESSWKIFLLSRSSLS